ncbi:MAG: ATP-binding protein [Deltaproteobacteria bacterium]|nr:ATP-binding protein [Deltaproteobacteria bacterium]
MSDLLDFARPVNLAPRPVPVDRLLDEAWNAAATASNEAAIEVRREMSPGQPGVDLEVEDTGAGLGNVDLSRVFEPFFTSKATGTGLGLAVVRRIIEEHGGTVSLRPGSQGGAVFTARLPVRSGQGPFNGLATPADGISVASGI